MKRPILFSLLLSFLFLLDTQAQRVGINATNPDASAALEIRSTTGGLLIPRMTNAQMNLIINPAAGLLIFNTDSASYYLYERGQWTALMSQNKFIGKRSVNNGAFTDYVIDRKRYMWEIGAAGVPGNSVPIPDSVLFPLCGDEDGCTIKISMANWQGLNETPRISQGHFTLNTTTRQWQFSDGSLLQNVSSGTDGNNLLEHVMSIYSQVYFTDGSYTSSAGTDAATGFHLLKWNSYPNSICRLVIED